MDKDILNHVYKDSTILNTLYNETYKAYDKKIDELIKLRDKELNEIWDAILKIRNISTKKED
jgi:hypothetical protein